MPIADAAVVLLPLPQSPVQVLVLELAGFCSLSIINSHKYEFVSSHCRAVFAAAGGTFVTGVLAANSMQPLAICECPPT